MPEFFKGASADEVWRLTFARVADPCGSHVISSRNGPARELLQTLLHIENPRLRWVTSREPSMNLAFAIAEVVWIIRGRQDSEFLMRWNSALCRYVGHGPTLHGAYGFRLRKHFGIDQLAQAATALKCNLESRQVVLQIWDATIDAPDEDGNPKNEDIPCNVLSMLKVRNGKLEWSQVMRSNDVFRGLPYNLVQFTLLQEVLAGWIGVQVGSYTHFADSMHLYESDESRVSKQREPQLPDKSLSLPKEESEKAFQMLEALMDALESPVLERSSLGKLVAKHSFSDAFQDLAAIVTSEAARRRMWFDECLQVLDLCSNPVMRSLALQWFRERKRKPDLLDQIVEPSDLLSAS